jgi:hypothetical protein
VRFRDRYRLETTGLGKTVLKELKTLDFVIFDGESLLQTTIGRQGGEDRIQAGTLTDSEPKVKYAIKTFEEFWATADEKIK